jgi:hypothetical protein
MLTELDMLSFTFLLAAPTHSVPELRTVLKILPFFETTLKSVINEREIKGDIPLVVHELFSSW